MPDFLMEYCPQPVGDLTSIATITASLGVASSIREERAGKKANLVPSPLFFFFSS